MSGCPRADSNHKSSQYLPHHNPLLYLSTTDKCFPATHVASVMIPGTSHCHGGLTCHCAWALPPILLSGLYCAGSCGWSRRWMGWGKTAIDLLHWRTGWGGKPEVVGLRLRRLSGFKGCRSSETAQRTKAFIINKVTGFSESNSGEKWTAAMAALTKTAPFFLPFTGLSFQQQETSQTYCHSNTHLLTKSHICLTGNDILKWRVSRLHTVCRKETNTKTFQTKVQASGMHVSCVWTQSPTFWKSVFLTASFRWQTVNI